MIKYITQAERCIFRWVCGHHQSPADRVNQKVSRICSWHELCMKSVLDLVKVSMIISLYEQIFL
jgi:hypothetical protein